MEYELTYELTYSNLSEGWAEGGGGVPKLHTTSL